MQYLVVETDAPDRWIALFKTAVDAIEYVNGSKHLDVLHVDQAKWVQR